MAMIVLAVGNCGGGRQPAVFPPQAPQHIFPQTRLSIRQDDQCPRGGDQVSSATFVCLESAMLGGNTVDSRGAHRKGARAKRVSSVRLLHTARVEPYLSSEPSHRVWPADTGIYAPVPAFTSARENPSVAGCRGAVLSSRNLVKARSAPSSRIHGPILREQ